MDENKISLRYAKALFSLAREKALLDRVNEDISRIMSSLKAVPEFKTVLASPVVKTSEKADLFKEAFDNNVDPITYSFLNLLLTNKREFFLDDILRNFLDLYRKYKGFKSAVLSSASPLDQDTVEHFRNLIRQKFNTEVDLSFSVNENLIGGFILRVEDQQIDASVSSKLKQLKQELIKKI
jgi:F-type H+-transporting ATPase subunit delta